VHLPNGDSIHVAKNGDSTYTGSHATGGDGTKPVHHKSQDEALEQARQKYEFPPTPNHPRFGQIALGKPLPGEVARAIQDQPVDQTV
jgi:hypothetical protein